MTTLQPISTNPRFIDRTGLRFGRLVVLGFAGKRGTNNFWLCRCDCGQEKEVAWSALGAGLTRSCGCLRDELIRTQCRTHGRARTPEYVSWCSMINRCTNEADKTYQNYGARGITICERWRHSFENFFADMGKKPSSGHSIDRIDNDGHYTPENCRWATALQQSRNRRRRHRVTFRGETHCLTEWAEITGLKFSLLSDRFKAGWPPELALTTPARPMRRKRQPLTS